MAMLLSEYGNKSTQQPKREREREIRSEAIRYAELSLRSNLVSFFQYLVSSRLAY